MSTGTTASDAADRIAHDARQIVTAIASPSDQTEMLASLRAPIAEYKGIDTVSARRRIGDAAIQARRYPY